MDNKSKPPIYGISQQDLTDVISWYGPAILSRSYVIPLFKFYFSRWTGV